MTAFVKRVENFVCEHCGETTVGTGYTNHCPKCLYSKHVDIDPGDRAETCQGLMEPVGVTGSSPNYRIEHKCRTCGKVRLVDASPEDDPENLVALAVKRAA